MWYIFIPKGANTLVTISLIITSITTMVLQNCLFNSYCKTKLKTEKSINFFNIMVYSVCILIFGILLLNEKISVYTVLLGLLFGIVTALSNLFKMLSLSSGSMNITLLVTTSSMIIPTMSGVFFGEKFSFSKLCVVFILIVFIYLSVSKSEDTKINKKWFLFCLLAFIFQGTVGVLQKIHQNSSHKTEVSGFLFIAFICAVVFCFLRSRGPKQKITFNKMTVFVGLVCGGCTFGMNYINLKLSGVLPSQLFFPLINGSAIVLSSLMSIIIFKERLSKRQTVGLIGGIASLIAICLVP